MDKISKEELEDLAYCIKNALREEFADKHLSGNLLNTIKIEVVGDDKVNVIIPAEVYNFYRFFKDRVIIPRGGGSYASRLDKEGSSFVVYHKGGRSFVKPHNHIGYVDRVINEALDQWLLNHKEKFEMKSRRET